MKTKAEYFTLLRKLFSGMKLVERKEGKPK